MTPNPKTSTIAPQHAASQTTNTHAPKPYQILSGSKLKYIAFISMLVDHTNNALITPMLNGKGTLIYISNTFSIIGRIPSQSSCFYLSKASSKHEVARNTLQAF